MSDDYFGMDDPDQSDEDHEDESHQSENLEGLVSKGHHFVGNPDADSQHWHQQSTDYNCAEVVQLGIMESLTGLDFSEIDVTALAAEHGWMTTHYGTELLDVDKVLEYFNVDMHQESHANIVDIMQELAQGHKVIVGLHGDVPHAGQSSLFGFQESETSGHAVWVTGVDNSDPDDIKVIVNDSADPHGAGKLYSLEEFKQAWSGSDFFYSATDEAPEDIHIHSPEFDQSQGEFSAMANWIKEHASESFGATGGLVTGMTLAEKLKNRKNSANKPPKRQKKRDPELQQTKREERSKRQTRSHNATQQSQKPKSTKAPQHTPSHRTKAPVSRQNTRSGTAGNGLKARMQQMLIKNEHKRRAVLGDMNKQKVIDREERQKKAAEEIINQVKSNVLPFKSNSN